MNFIFKNVSVNNEMFRLISMLRPQGEEITLICDVQERADVSYLDSWILCEKQEGNPAGELFCLGLLWCVCFISADGNMNSVCVCVRKV